MDVYRFGVGGSDRGYLHLHGEGIVADALRYHPVAQLVLQLLADKGAGCAAQFVAYLGLGERTAKA